MNGILFNIYGIQSFVDVAKSLSGHTDSGSQFNLLESFNLQKDWVEHLSF